jgi:hypothetical protein
MSVNNLYFGDKPEILRNEIKSESVDRSISTRL